jgi:DNA-binding NarL/FixJ family response regulator
VIVTTAFQKSAFVDCAIAAGAEEIFHKPISLKALEEMMRCYLSPLLGSCPMDRRASLALLAMQ